jgi:hypothetical protein
MKQLTTYRVIAETESATKVVTTKWSLREAREAARTYLASLDPNNDECPEMTIEFEGVK